MKRTEIETMLIECIREVQEISGKQAVELNLETCPFEHLEGFDSLTAVETTELLSQRMQEVRGMHLHSGKADVNLFVSKDGRKALKLSEVVDRVESLVVAVHGK